MHYMHADHKFQAKVPFFMYNCPISNNRGGYNKYTVQVGNKNLNVICINFNLHKHCIRTRVVLDFLLILKLRLSTAQILCWSAELKHSRISLHSLKAQVNKEPFNPPTTAWVKISQNVDILPKVYLVHLKVKHWQTLRVVSTFTGQNESTVFDW